MRTSVTERGSGTLLVVALLAALTLVAGGLLAALAWQVEAHRVEGAADLVALTGARAQDVGAAPACEAAARAAEAERVILASCRAAGEVNVVVRVTVNDPGSPWARCAPLTASSNAGVDRGAP